MSTNTSNDPSTESVPCVTPVSQSDHTISSTPSDTRAKTNKLMINPNCPTQILLDYVCTEIGIDKNSNFDFCDLETGKMIGIKQNKPWAYATNVLKSRQTYIIIFYEKDDFGQYNKVEPFINKQSRQYSEIITKITRQLSSTRKLSATARNGSKAGSIAIKVSAYDSHKTQRKGSRSARRSSSRN